MNSMKLILICLITILLTSGIISIGQTLPGIETGSYLQDIKTDIKLPEQAEKNVLKLFTAQNNLIAVTSNGVFKNRDGKWSSTTFGSGWRTAAIDPNGEIWLASTHSIQKEGDTKKIDLPDFAQHDTIICLMWENEKTLHVGTSNGLLTNNGAWNLVDFVKGKRVNSIVKDSKGDLWLATTDGLLRRMSGKWLNMDDNLMAYGLKRTYFTLESRKEKAEVLFGGLFSVGCIAEDGNNWNLRGADGLPYGPITSIHSFGETIWLGTDRGAIKKDKSWHYYNGKRWLTGNKVNDILPVDEHTIWVATPQGISQIQEVEMTLAQKAASFEERIRLRHLRHGLVSRSVLGKPGDLTTSIVTNTNNEGLWTSIYLAAECFRFALTKAPEAKANAEKAFEAMERLETVTGISGYPARSIALPDEQVGKGEWHLSADKKWKWLGDSSSDEMIGHLFAYPIFYDLVAEGKMKTRVEDLVKRILNHVIDNNYKLIDLDGKPTRWGVWSPDSLNLSPNWAYERGTNSLQILSFLKAGYYITGEQKFNEAANYLIKKHGYAENMIQLKKYGPFDVNYVDNQLAFLPYYIIAWYDNDATLQPYFEKSMIRTWNVVREDQISMWNIIASASLKKDCDLQIALAELKSIPMDLVNWTIENSHRWDLPQNPINDRMDHKQSIRPISATERGITKWNLNPYRYDFNANGMEENDGAFFLLAYWMGRYHGFFIEN
jgi:hypothetical protein